MNLEITNENNIFLVVGTLNKLNVQQFKNEFLNIFEKQNALVISIENVTSIDRYGVNALAQLHNEALRKHKKLSIIGIGSDDLYEHFKSEEPAA